MFFKGETGRIILQDPPVQSPDLFLFLDFIRNEKGHEVTVEGHYLASPSFYQKALENADLNLRFDGEEKSFLNHLRELGVIHEEIRRRKITRSVMIQLDIKNPEYKRLRNILSDVPWKSWLTTGYYVGKIIIPSETMPLPQMKETPRMTTSGVRMLLFIPMRNCGNSVAKVISRLDQKVLSHVNEILILDNDSNDQSMKAASEASKSIEGTKVIIRKNEKNYGFGGSHKLAFQYAHLNKMDYVLVVHGDDSGSPSDFLKVLDSGEFRDYDIVLSSRLSFSGIRENYPFYRFAANWVLNLLASIVTLSRVSDFSGGPVGLYRVQTFINKFENPVRSFSDRISFTQDALLFVNNRRGLVKFVPVSYREAGGKSFYSAFTQFIHSSLRLLSYRFR